MQPSAECESESSVIALYAPVREGAHHKSEQGKQAVASRF